MEAADCFVEVVFKPGNQAPPPASAMGTMYRKAWALRAAALLYLMVLGDVSNTDHPNGDSRPRIYSVCFTCAQCGAKFQHKGAMARHTCHRKRAIASGLGDRKSQAKKQAICVTSDDAPDLPEVEGPPSPAEALPQLDPRLDHPVHAAPPPGEAGVGDIRPPARTVCACSLS